MTIEPSVCSSKTFLNSANKVLIYSSIFYNLTAVYYTKIPLVCQAGFD